MPTAHVAQLSNVRLEYFLHGHGPERVVLIHGFQASARIWAMVQEALPSDRYTSIAINNRGAGNSDAPPAESDFGVPVFAADAHELMTGLQWDAFTLVGHSLGGATAAQFAVDHPQGLKGLVLLDPADPDGRAGSAQEIEAAVDAFTTARRARLARGGSGADGINATAAGVSGELLALLTADMNNAPERRLRGSLRSMFQVRLGPRVRELTMPVLLACGDRDELIPLQNMLETWAKLPHGTGLHVWHGVGHSPNLDTPAAFTALLRQFIETTIPALGKSRP